MPALMSGHLAFWDYGNSVHFLMWGYSTQGEEVAATLPTLNSIRTSLYQSCRLRYPPMSESVEDLDFTREWAMTDKNQTYFHGWRDSSVFIFTAEHNLHILSTAEMFSRDGTFSICLASFPGSHIPEREHWSCAGVESLVFFLTWEVVKVEKR